ncbi:putative mediator of RNA polymerase II transcription subunit 10 [Podospora australis]|uniref:Mediator of RNA polymerase II transcription subunit 10 n=1 Tax=Podospora australis TaxID=1536484 RepID=A0AAN6WUX6_9PEZI|nr:putative mediator of RNA polymerase II transcription subunit 10 [Podospora australis]
MAPVNSDLNQVQESIKNTITDLFTTLTNLSTYDQTGRPSRETLAADLSTLDSSLLSVHRTASSLPPDKVPGIPIPLMEYVENGRNPDIYTREFVELVRRLNQLTRGKMHAFRDFRDTLAHEVGVAMPECKEDAMKVVENTGGAGPVLRKMVEEEENPEGGSGQGQQQTQFQYGGQGQQQSLRLGPGGNQ